MKSAQAFVERVEHLLQAIKKMEHDRDAIYTTTIASLLKVIKRLEDEVAANKKDVNKE